ncbi:hypothetical protein HMPREF1575_00949 [Gardnerella vaginalis JCP7672]|nr:hypothetical protein HMPREF1575_00949 [Gardnerella vaginalis JCP7672]
MEFCISAFCVFRSFSVFSTRRGCVLSCYVVKSTFVASRGVADK